MSRMLEALRALETRKRGPIARDPEVAAPPQAAWPAIEVSPAQSLDSSLESLTQLVDTLEPPTPKPPQPAAGYEVCTLPLAPEVADHYQEMAATISEQMASNYCNVLLFSAADRWVDPSFSMTHLAQGFAMQSAGDVLLVDGDLRFGRLSKSIARPGPGMIEAMLGRAQWTDIIHPTNTGRIDFVTCGNAQVPTFERSQFGWGALRPLYRVVLIGLAAQAEPETTWLGARCDAVYYVLSRPHTRRSTASAAVNALRSSGANVMGSIVVND